MSDARMNLLGDGPLHQWLAAQLGLSITTRPDSDAVPLVVVAEQAQDVQAIVRARSWLPVRAIITWRLPESAVVRLHDLEVPVFIGLPDLETFRARVLEGADPVRMAEERRRAARLAAVEASLTGKGRADESLSTRLVAPS
ncbi:MAG: hypothetical protein ACKO91_18875 [Acidimicrobiales bacterium]